MEVPHLCSDKRSKVPGKCTKVMGRPMVALVCHILLFPLFPLIWACKGQKGRRQGSKKLLWICSSNLPRNFALKNGSDFWWIFSGLCSPRNEERKLLKKIGENSEQNSGGTFVCNFSDLKIPANLVFQTCISFYRCFGSKENPSVYWHATLSCPLMAPSYTNFVSRSDLVLEPWIFYPISLCKRISRFIAFQTKVAYFCFALFA